MKINFIVPEITRTGGMRVIFEYANRLTEKGHDVTLYSRIIPLSPYKYKIKLYYLRYQIKYGLNYLKRKPLIPENIFAHNFKIKLIYILNNYFIEDADVSIATAWTTAYPTYKLKKSKGKKFYLIQDYENWNADIKYVDLSYKLPLNKIVVAKHLRNFLKNRFGVESIVIYIGIELDKFNNINKEFKRPFRILFLDHLLENKNSIRSIKIFEMLRNKYPDLKFRGFGIKKYHQMPDYIEFFENPDSNTLTRIYCESDIFLYPTLREGCPATPAEAMACKCAVVANSAAAIPEYCTNMVNAILCDPEKPEEIFNGACYLIDNPQELKRISLEGYKQARDFFKWERSADEFEKFLLNT